MTQSHALHEEMLPIGTWAAGAFSGNVKAVAGPTNLYGTRFPQVLPFSFTYGGIASSDLLPKWESMHTTTPLDESRLARILEYKDPKTGLSLQCKAIIYSDYPTIDYVLRFTNSGTNDSLLLEHILPLDVWLGVNSNERVQLHTSRGGIPAADAFKLNSEILEEGNSRALCAGGRRSSKDCMPWFNLQWPDGGPLVAIGWSGQWRAEISRDQAVHLTAGMEDSR